MLTDITTTIPDGWKLLDSSENAQMDDKFWDFVQEAWLPVLANEARNGYICGIRPSLVIRKCS